MEKFMVSIHAATLGSLGVTLFYALDGRDFGPALGTTVGFATAAILAVCFVRPAAKPAGHDPLDC